MIRRPVSCGVAAALLAVGAWLPASSRAGDDYLCTVRASYSLTDAGELVPDESFSAWRVGQRFGVSRTTGEMTGDVEEPAWTRVTVLDRGSSEQSFKVVAVSTAQFPFLHYLEVQEFVESSDKPFVYQASPNTLTGTCESL